MIRSRLLRALACVAAGTLLFLSCADFDIWPLAWIGIVPLLLVVLDEDCSSPFLYGWLTGIVANAGGFYWINGLLQRFGHLPFVATAPIFLLLVAYQGLPFGLFAWIVRQLGERTKLPMVLLAPVTMTALELVVPFVFPWYLAITQAWVRPVIQIADITGPLGVTFLLVMSNGALYDVARALIQRRRPPARPVIVFGCVLAVALGYGQVRIRQVEAKRAAAPKLKVGVVQANIGINEKFVPGLREQQLDLHQRLSAQLADRGAQLIVWPESAYPYLFGREQKHDFPDGRMVQRGFHVPILFGALTASRDSPYFYNSALLLDKNGDVKGRFDKNYLLVFGEYIPFYEEVKWIRKYIPEAANFARGHTVTTFPLDGHRIAPMICYEDIIPSFARRLARLKPELFVNITNDAWFGATSEPWEHLALAVFRTVEHRVDMVRAVNTGVSAFVDATGRVYAHGPAVDPLITPDVQPVTLLQDVALMQPSGLYGTIGDLFGILNLVALLGLGVWARRHAGLPIAWGPVALGAGTALAVTAAGALLVVGAPHLLLATKLFAHRPLAPSAETFRVGLRLSLVGLFAAAAAGFVVGCRVSERSSRVEVAIAMLAAFLAPPMLFGRLAGETASLAFTAIGVTALGFLGARYGCRVVRGARGKAPRRKARG